MTEAAHQMTSNPLELGKQKAGCVGIVTSPEICIMDSSGNQLSPGEEGEVCIRGRTSLQAMKTMKLQMLPASQMDGSEPVTRGCLT